MPAPFVPVGPTGYHLFEVDAAGFPVLDDAIPRLQDHLAQGAYTDVVVISHGYATSKVEDGSVPFCTKVVRAMDGERPVGVRVLYVGVHWPSFPTTLFQGAGKGAKEHFDALFKRVSKRDAVVENRAFQIGGEEAVHDDIDESAVVDAMDAMDPAELAQLVDKDTDPEAAKCLAKIIECIAAKRASDSAPVGDEEPEVPHALHNEIRTEMANLCKALCPDDAAVDLDEVDGVSADPANIVKRDFDVMAEKTSVADGLSKKSSVLDAVQAAPGKVAKVAKRGYNSILYNIVFKQFERRASIVGSLGVHGLLAKLMERAKAPVKFHLFGHSLGGHVVTSAAIGRKPQSYLRRKIHTLMIAQGALDARSFSKDGAYRLIVSHLKPVAGPVLATKSPFDGALRMYSIFSAKPLGILGVRDPVPAKHEEILLKLRGEDKRKQAFNFRGGQFYTLDGRLIITEAKPDVFGIDFDKAHGDIDDPETMGAFWSACQTKLKGGESAYQCVDPNKLPEGFWDNYDIEPENKFFGCCLS